MYAVGSYDHSAQAANGDTNVCGNSYSGGTSVGASQPCVCLKDTIDACGVQRVTALSSNVVSVNFLGGAQFAHCVKAPDTSSCIDKSSPPAIKRRLALSTRTALFSPNHFAWYCTQGSAGRPACVH
jgi:hypothetical protein